MNLPLTQLLRWLIFTLIFPLIFLNGWLLFKFCQFFQPLLTILILSTLLAFILNYPVSLLERWKIKRNYAVALVFIFTLLIVIILGVTLLPKVLEQFQEMVKLLPEWVDNSETKLQHLNNLVFGQRVKVDFSHTLINIINRLPNELESIFNRLFKLVLETLDSISEGLITIVLTLYLLVDGGRITDGIFKRLPLGFGQTLKTSLQHNFQNYLIGQISLALLMGVSQTLMFLLLRVKFGLLFGLGMGVLSLVPFGDVVSLIVIILIIASHNFWLAVQVLAVAVVIDQLIDQAIAPRLLGKFTGIRPIWVIISLLVGTYIGGVLGLLVAVPVAGCLKDGVDGLSSKVETEALPEIL